MDPGDNDLSGLDPFADPSSQPGQPPDLPAPESLEEIRHRVSGPRFRVYRKVDEILEQVAEIVDWELLYDAESPVEDYLTWGYFLDEVIARLSPTLRTVLEAPAPAGEPPEDRREELEDLIFWTTRQIELALQQPQAVLKKVKSEIVGSSSRDSKDPRHKEDLCAAVADVAGRLRSEIRRFAAFVVAEGKWNIDASEVVLFPAKRKELEQSRRLKNDLLAIMESFQGSTDRLPMTEVIRLWRQRQAQGPHVLVELEQFQDRLAALVDKDTRNALYAESYQKLARWLAEIKERTQALGDFLGNEEKETALAKELAALLDAELLAELLGWDSAEEVLDPPEPTAITTLLTDKGIKKLGWGGNDTRRLLELRDVMAAREVWPQNLKLADDDRRLLLSAMALINGKSLVEHLRSISILSPDMQSLRDVQRLLLESEDGLRTYLVLLFGQLKNRDLRQVEEKAEDVSYAERQLAVQEIHYFLNRLVRTEDFHTFEALRALAAEKDAPLARYWRKLTQFLRTLRREVVPRLQGLVPFPEVEGKPGEWAEALGDEATRLLSIEEPTTDNSRTIASALERIARLLKEVRSIQIAPPPAPAPKDSSEEDVEDFLRSLGL